jgi:hypothetical protein
VDGIVFKIALIGLLGIAAQWAARGFGCTVRVAGCAPAVPPPIESE